MVRTCTWSQLPCGFSLVACCFLHWFAEDFCCITWSEIGKEAGQKTGICSLCCFHLAQLISEFCRYSDSACMTWSLNIQKGSLYAGLDFNFEGNSGYVPSISGIQIEFYRRKMCSSKSLESRDVFLYILRFEQSTFVCRGLRGFVSM